MNIFFANRPCGHQWHMVLRLLWWIDELHFKLLSINWNFSTHVTKVEWTWDHIPVLTRIHGSEFNGCLSTSLHIVYFLLTRCTLVICVELFQPSQFFIYRVEGVFVVLAVIIDYICCTVMELLFNFVIAVEYFFEVILRYVWVTAFVDYSLNCSFGGSVHQTQLDQH